MKRVGKRRSSRFSPRKMIQGVSDTSSAKIKEKGPNKCVLCKMPISSNSKRPTCDSCHSVQPWDR